MTCTQVSRSIDNDLVILTPEPKNFSFPQAARGVIRSTPADRQLASFMIRTTTVAYLIVFEPANIRMFECSILETKNTIVIVFCCSQIACFTSTVLCHQL